MKNLFGTAMLACYQKRPRLYNTLFFLAGIALTGLYISPPITGGFFLDELIPMCAEFLILSALFGYTAFGKPLMPYTFSNTSMIEALISLVLAAIAGFRIVSRFFNTFFEQILQGGDTPSLVWAVYSKLPFSPALNASLLYAFCIVSGLLAVFALFILMLYLVRLLRVTYTYTTKHMDYDTPAQMPPLRKRFLIGTLLALATAVLCFFTLNYGQEWGADYALYMNYALQIAKGIPGQMSASWGFPLMLAPIYKVFGYDTTLFTSIIYYKIPGVICMTLLTFFLFLFFSKRFPVKWAIVLTAFFGLNPIFIRFTNEILTNIPHLLFSMLSIMCMQQMFLEKKLSRQIIDALLSGLCICVASLVRANGILLVMALGCLHLVCLVCYLFRKNTFLHGLTAYYTVSRVWVHFVPYVTYYAATKLIYSLIQAPVVVTNMFSIASNRLTVPFFEGVQYNFSLLESFLQSLLPLGVFPELALWILVPLVLAGIVRCFRKDMLSVIYFCGTLLFFILLRLRQGLRYLFPILPMLILFLAAGVQALISAREEQGCKRYLNARIVPIIAIVCVVGLLYSSLTGAVGNMLGNRQFNSQSFSESAKAAYRYIQAETEENAVIIFFKPEVVSLNTGRASSSTGSMTSDLESPTYLLVTDDRTREDQLIPDEYPTAEALERAYDVTVTLIYTNDLFQLYSIAPNSYSG